MEEYTQAQRELSEVGPVADLIEQLRAMRQEVRWAAGAAAGCMLCHLGSLRLVELLACCLSFWQLSPC